MDHSAKCYTFHTLVRQSMLAHGRVSSGFLPGGADGRARSALLGGRVEASGGRGVGCCKGRRAARQRQQARGAAGCQLGGRGGDLRVVVPRQQAELPHGRRQRAGLQGGLPIKGPQKQRNLSACSICAIGRPGPAIINPACTLISATDNATLRHTVHRHLPSTTSATSTPNTTHLCWIVSIWAVALRGGPTSLVLQQPLHPPRAPAAAQRMAARTH